MAKLVVTSEKIAPAFYNSAKQRFLFNGTPQHSSSLRLQNMKEKQVIDLFAGVGGLSLGAARAGFRVAASVEIDEHANHYHGVNFPKTRHIREDVLTLTGERLFELAGMKSGRLDGLIGGPPCQGFSSIGRRAPDDPRNQLFTSFFRLVSETKPAFYLAENVPGITQARNVDFVEHARRFVPPNYVNLAPILVRASDFGAPTNRSRVFFIGYDPAKMNEISSADFAPTASDDVRVGRALQALPAIRSTWLSEEQSWRSVGQLGRGAFESRVANFVPAGVGASSAIKLYRTRGLVSGCFGTVHAEETVRRFRETRPGTTDSTSRCYRLMRDGYCPTLRAGTGSDRGSYQAIRPIHPSSHRVITPREAARLQGFPDWFQFHPTKWHSFRQIGNSVSPIVGEVILRVIASALR